MKFTLFAMTAHCCLIQFGIQCNTQVFLSKAPHSGIHSYQSGNSWYVGLFQPECKTALLIELHEVSIHQILHFLKALLNKALLSTTPLCQPAITCKLSGIVFCLTIKVTDVVLNKVSPSILPQLHTTLEYYLHSIYFEYHKASKITFELLTQAYI